MGRQKIIRGADIKGVTYPSPGLAQNLFLKVVEFPRSFASRIPSVDTPIVPVLKCYLWKPLGGGGGISSKHESD